MSTQHTFTEYVAARWAVLYRLAVLLVGETNAEDLTQAALLKAYLSWQRAVDAESTDAYVKKILVNTAISQGRKRRPLTVAGVEERPVDSHESAVLERDALWPRIESLPPRQRAVIVLRYYEDLSEAEIARTLGCANGTVKAHAAAGLKALRISITDAADAFNAETSGGRHD